MPPPRKPCDGSSNDYMRHVKRGETACAASKKGNAIARRRYERTGVWYGGLPYHPSDEIVYPVTEENRVRYGRNKRD